VRPVRSASPVTFSLRRELPADQTGGHLVPVTRERSVLLSQTTLCSILKFNGVRVPPSRVMPLQDRHHTVRLIKNCSGLRLPLLFIDRQGPEQEKDKQIG